MTDSTPETELLVATGDDVIEYLDSQCTQDLSHLELGERTQTLVLSPAGDVVTIAVIRRDGDQRVSLEVPTGTGTATVARLERFAIRADVAFEGPMPLDDREEAAYPDELARIKAGVPGAEELAKTLVPHALSEELRERCVSFTKGCYPGQELVARMRSRHATPPYVLRRCTLDGPGRPGDALGDPGKAGSLTSVAYDEQAAAWRALCVLHRRDAEHPSVTVHASPASMARLE